MAVPPLLLQQLLALEEPVRMEIAHALLASVGSSADELSDADRDRLEASIERSLDQLDAGQGVPVEQAIAAIRARRATRARPTR